MTTLRYGSATDVGRVRSNNEDNLVVAEPLFAVADGMGGHAAGEVASEAAVEALRTAFTSGPATVDTLVEAVTAANRAVWDRAADDPELRGMGTTITALALVIEDGEEHLAIANVGDSRAYLLRDGELSQLTDDHSVAEQMVREGQLLPEEAAMHPQRHVLTRVLGMAPEIPVDCYPILPFRGDRILLCTDGLVNEVSDSQIASLLRRRADPSEAAAELVQMARENGGHDNITVVVVDVVDDDDRAEQASAALAADGDSDGDDGTRTMVAPVVPAATTGADTDRHADTDDPPLAAGTAVERPARSASAGEDADAEPSSPRSRRVTFRVVLFLVVFVAVLAGAGAAVGYYARGSYFVGIDHDRVTIFKGRPGGVLWFDPTIEQHTDLAAADVPPGRLEDVRGGVEESSVAAARRFVRNLQDEHARLTAADQATTTTTTSTVPPVAPPPAPAPQPSPTP